MKYKDLLSEDGDVIEVFPQLLEDGEKEIVFWKLHTSCGIHVSARLKKGKLEELTIESPCSMQVKLKGWNKNGERQSDMIYSVTLQPGENYFIKTKE